jgi:hypothetical protein
MNHAKPLLTAVASFAVLLLIAPAAFAQTNTEGTGGTGTGGTTGPTGTTGTPGTGTTGTPGTDGQVTGGTTGETEVEVAAMYLPVPAARAAEVTRAVSALSTRLDRVRTTGDIGIKLNCWVHKLGEADLDDRVIKWTRICPNLQTGPAKASSVCEPPMTVPEESLYQSVKTVDEVETANNSLYFMARLKSEVLDLQTSFPGNDRDQFVVDQLLHMIRDVEAAQQELDAMAASTEHGGIPRHFRSMREWIARKSRDPKSLYSPCGG